MSTDKGYVRIYRDIRDHWIWSDSEYFQKWVDLIMMANHKDKGVLFDKRVIVVKRGSCITSIRKLAEKWHWSRNRVARFLDMLERDTMIATKRDTKKTLITIVNYDNYQTRVSKSGPLMKPQTKPHAEPQTEPQAKHKQYIKEDIKKTLKRKDDIFDELDDDDELPDADWVDA